MHHVTRTASAFPPHASADMFNLGSCSAGIEFDYVLYSRAMLTMLFTGLEICQ